jgi:hypothetical protein
MVISVLFRSSVRNRRPSPMTRFHRVLPRGRAVGYVCGRRITGPWSLDADINLWIFGVDLGYRF